MTKWPHLTVVTGALGIFLGFPNAWLSLPPLVLLWPAALILSGLRAGSVGSAFLFGLAINFPGMFAALYWLAFPIHDVGGLALPFALTLAALVSLALASLFALFPTVVHLSRHLPLFCSIPGCALFWTLLELSSDFVCGFPWLPLSGALAVWPVLIQSAALFGHFGTACFYLLSLLLLLYPIGAGKKGRTLSSSGLLLLTLLIVHGNLSLANCPEDREPRGGDSIGVLFVEGNFDQNLKWKPSLQRMTLARYADLTGRGLDGCGHDADLVIWPETAMPFFLERSPELAHLVRETARLNSVPLLFGIPGTSARPPLDGSPSPVYNRAILLGTDGTTRAFYDKEHLVPFGEYMPKFLDLPFLAPLLQDIGGYSAGTGSGLLSTGPIRAGMLICYEGIFPSLAQARVAAQANILIDISNDAWFRDTPASRQHLYLTALRAVEQKRSILRGTNSGISAIVDSHGRITTRGPLFTAGTVHGRARLHTETSFFHRHCFLLLSLHLFLTCAFLLLLCRRIRPSGKKW